MSKSDYKAYGASLASIGLAYFVGGTFFAVIVFIAGGCLVLWGHWGDSEDSQIGFSSERQIAVAKRKKRMTFAIYAFFLVLAAVGLVKFKIRSGPNPVLQGNQTSETQPPKEKAAVEVAETEGNYFTVKPEHLFMTVLARNEGPAIARNVQGYFWLGPVPFKPDVESNQMMQDFAFPRMLKDFYDSLAQHPFSLGPSLGIGQTNAFATNRVYLTSQQFNDWKLQKQIIYLMGEITWTDDFGQSKTDLCRGYLMPERSKFEMRNGVFHPCEQHNVIHEPLVHKP
jgi:uncharacterized membrane protein